MANASEVQGEDSNVTPTRDGCLVMDGEKNVVFAEFVNGVAEGYHEITMGEPGTANFPVPQVVSGSISAEDNNVLRASIEGAVNEIAVTGAPHIAKSAAITVLNDGTPDPPKVTVETKAAAIIITIAKTPKETRVPTPKP